MAARPLIVNAISKHTATVIMLHGLGDSGAGWVSLAENWRRRGKFDEVKFIFPNAPNLAITANGGYEMPGWYDIFRDSAFPNASFTDLNQAYDETGILKTRSYVNGLIESEVKDHDIPSERIILGGFSQGGAISIFTGLTIQRRLAGIFGLSCYLLLGNKIADLAKEANDANEDTPFFLAHGDSDPVVRYDWGKKTAQIVEKDLRHKVEFKTYRNLPHSAALEEIDDLEAWIRKCLTKQPTAESSSITKTASTELPEGQGSL